MIVWHLAWHLHTRVLRRVALQCHPDSLNLWKRDVHTGQRGWKLLSSRPKGVMYAEGSINSSWLWYHKTHWGAGKLRGHVEWGPGGQQYAKAARDSAQAGCIRSSAEGTTKLENVSELIRIFRLQVFIIIYLVPSQRAYHIFPAKLCNYQDQVLSFAIFHFQPLHSK